MVKVNKKALFILLAVIGVVLIVNGISFLINDGYKLNYKLDAKEAVAYTSLRLAISQSAYNGMGEISVEKLETLYSAIKKYNNKSIWFDDYYGTFYGKNTDNSEYQVDYICNDDYCAKLTIKNDLIDYYIIDYSFEEKNIKGYYIHINHE